MHLGDDNDVVVGAGDACGGCGQQLLHHQVLGLVCCRNQVDACVVLPLRSARRHAEHLVNAVVPTVVDHKPINQVIFIIYTSSAYTFLKYWALRVELE